MVQNLVLEYEKLVDPRLVFGLNPEREQGTSLTFYSASLLPEVWKAARNMLQ